MHTHSQGPIASRTISLIGVPLELGASQPGARQGPRALRAAGLASQLERLGYRVVDRGDIPIDLERTELAGGPGHPKHLAAIRDICATVADAVEEALRLDSFPVLLGGDHSLAIGALAGIARVKGPQGIIWMDAHADLNTPGSSPSGNVHGMSMAAALGEMRDVFDERIFPSPSVDVAHSVFVGLRDLDPPERNAIREKKIASFTMTDIDRVGMAQVMQQAIAIAGPDRASVHLSFDVDCLDPSLAPGTGTPVPGGLTYREAHLAMELLAQSGVAHSLELVEVNPALDQDDKTARLAAELICSALGKSIL